jgi:hypothetical protein
MRRWLTKVAVVAALLAAVLTAGSVPAFAGNNDPKSPNPGARTDFCNHPVQMWHLGYVYWGNSNDGTFGSWTINNMVDSPSAIYFYATFAGDHYYNVSWNC